jgi:acetyl esterase
MFPSLISMSIQHTLFMTILSGSILFRLVLPPPTVAQKRSLTPDAQVRLQPRTPIGVRYVYKNVDGEELALFVSSPPPSAQRLTHPAMLFFHGGGFVGGPLNQFDRQAQYLATRGLVAIQVQYRLEDAAGTAPIDPSMQDAKSAMRWVRSHASDLDLDPDRIGAAGGSAGGQLAAFVGMMDGKEELSDDLSVSSRANLMVLFNPVLDLGPDSCCYRHSGDDYKARSPLYHIHSGLPSSLVFQGESDTTVSPSMISAFVASMKRRGNACTVEWYPNVGHGFFNVGENFYKTLKQMDIFLVEHGWLRGTPDNNAIRQLSPVM